MKRRFKNLSITLLISSILLLGLLGCSSIGEEEEKVVIEDNGPQEFIEGIEVYEMKGSIPEYKLKAEVIKNFYDIKRTIAYKAQLDSYDKDGNHYSYIECDSAYVENDGDLIKAYGHVYLKTPNGIVKTDYIYWDKPSDKVLAPNKVVLIRDDNEVSGFNLRTDSRFRITNMDNVKAVGTVNEKDSDL
jgi:LPS export ABC transporter protein LptC